MCQKGKGKGKGCVCGFEKGRLSHLSNTHTYLSLHTRLSGLITRKKNPERVCLTIGPAVIGIDRRCLDIDVVAGLIVVETLLSDSPMGYDMSTPCRSPHVQRAGRMSQRVGRSCLFLMVSSLSSLPALHTSVKEKGP